MMYHARYCGRFLMVRPAWAHSCGCKFGHALITANEVKPNCVRGTEREIGKRRAQIAGR